MGNIFVVDGIQGTVYVIQSLLVGLISIMFTIIQFLRVRENNHTVLEGQQHIYCIQGNRLTICMQYRSMNPESKVRGMSASMLNTNFGNWSITIWCCMIYSVCYYLLGAWTGVSIEFQGDGVWEIQTADGRKAWIKATGWTEHRSTWEGSWNWYQFPAPAKVGGVSSNPGLTG